MRINNNLMAMNTNRQLGISNKAGAKSMEKLSSGFRINRAADDAAGLSISEKMRNQIKGLNRASANAQDGISLIQTAEGALDESHAILKRMRELTVQAGNEGTLQQDDLEAIKDEFNELASELDGISGRTEFNGKKLLDGSYEGTLQIGANQDQQLDLNVAVTNATGVDSLKGTTIVKGKTETEVKDYTLGKLVIESAGEVKVATAAAPTQAEEVKVDVAEDGKINITLKADDTKQSVIEQALKDAGVKVTTTGTLADTDVTKVNATAVAGDARKVSEGGSTSSKDLGVALTAEADITKDAAGKVTNLDDVLAKGTFFGFEGMSQEDVKKATDANLERMDAANKAVSKVRSHLGANQNRLEHTIRNLDNAAENIQASESRIRDVDMAKEMIENTKQNILQQASTAMLAQANQAPQSVLRLLG